MRKECIVETLGRDLPDLSLRDFLIFNDSWICPTFTMLVNSKTGKVHKILAYKPYVTSEWDDPELIQYNAARMIEVTRSAIKIEDQHLIKKGDGFFAI